MYVHDQLIKDRHDDLRRAAARDRLAAQARRARTPWPGHARAARTWRRAPVRLRQLFS